MQIYVSTLVHIYFSGKITCAEIGDAVKFARCQGENKGMYDNDNAKSQSMYKGVPVVPEISILPINASTTGEVLENCATMPANRQYQGLLTVPQDTELGTTFIKTSMPKLMQADSYKLKIFSFRRNSEHSPLYGNPRRGG